MDDKRLAELAFNVKYGVKAGHRLLEDNGNLIASDLAHFVDGNFGNILPVEQNLAAFDPAVLVEQAQYTHRLDAFSASGFAEDAKAGSLGYL